MRIQSIGWVALLGLASCGGGAAATETSSETAGSETPDVAWADMTPEQKGQFMADVVVPTMRPIFQEIDGEHFAEFGCPTCHGANAREVGFHMPNGIAPLDANNMQQYFTSEEPIAIAMRERVWPRMGELLGEELYNPETHEGFSCLNCHGTQDDTVGAP